MRSGEPALSEVEGNLLFLAKLHDAEALYLQAASPQPFSPRNI
jgi:hypothetical protein